jgi:electron-transferring-flavoprotein dehydrogenase
MGRRILLAGCGDLGARLAKRLIARGDTVFGLRRRVHALAEGIVPVAADLNDPSSLGGLPQAISMRRAICWRRLGKQVRAGFSRPARPSTGATLATG